MEEEKEKPPFKPVWTPSYPFSKRQEVTPIPGYLEEYARAPTQPPMSLEEKQKRDEQMFGKELASLMRSRREQR